MEVCATKISRFSTIIPVRSGSKRKKDKNLALLGGYSLIVYSIALAKTTEGVDRIVECTGSLQYANIAKKYGADVLLINTKCRKIMTKIQRVL